MSAGDELETETMSYNQTSGREKASNYELSSEWGAFVGTFEQDYYPQNINFNDLVSHVFEFSDDDDDEISGPPEDCDSPDLSCNREENISCSNTQAPPPESCDIKSASVDDFGISSSFENPSTPYIPYSEGSVPKLEKGDESDSASILHSSQGSSKNGERPKKSKKKVNGTDISRTVTTETLYNGCIGDTVKTRKRVTRIPFATDSSSYRNSSESKSKGKNASQSSSGVTKTKKSKNKLSETKYAASTDEKVSKTNKKAPQKCYTHSSDDGNSDVGCHKVAVTNKQKIKKQKKSNVELSNPPNTETVGADNSEYSCVAKNCEAVKPDSSSCLEEAPKLFIPPEESDSYTRNLLNNKKELEICMNVTVSLGKKRLRGIEEYKAHKERIKRKNMVPNNDSDSVPPLISPQVSEPDVQNNNSTHSGVLSFDDSASPHSYNNYENIMLDNCENKVPKADSHLYHEHRRDSISELSVTRSFAVKQEPAEAESELSFCGSFAVKQEPIEADSRSSFCSPFAIKQEPTEADSRSSFCSPLAIKQEPTEADSRSSFCSPLAIKQTEPTEAGPEPSFSGSFAIKQKPAEAVTELSFFNSIAVEQKPVEVGLASSLDSNIAVNQEQVETDPEVLLSPCPVLCLPFDEDDFTFADNSSHTPEEHNENPSPDIPDDNSISQSAQPVEKCCDLIPEKLPSNMAENIIEDISSSSSPAVMDFPVKVPPTNETPVNEIKPSTSANSDKGIFQSSSPYLSPLRGSSNDDKSHRKYRRRPSVSSKDDSDYSSCDRYRYKVSEVKSQRKYSPYTFKSSNRRSRSKSRRSRTNSHRKSYSRSSSSSSSSSSSRYRKRRRKSRSSSKGSSSSSFSSAIYDFVYKDYNSSKTHHRSSISPISRKSRRSKYHSKSYSRKHRRSSRYRSRSSRRRRSRHSSSRRKGSGSSCSTSNSHYCRDETSSSRSRSRGRSSHRHSRSFKQQQMEEQQKQIDERRVVYVGLIPDNYSRSQLRNRFEKFGTILNVRIHRRTTRPNDNYGFVTFKEKLDAYQAVEYGNEHPLEPKFEISFGGRKGFCKQEYSDLDRENELKECYDFPFVAKRDETFDSLLQAEIQRTRNQTRRH